jgi:diguanylate cyclase (GGDEF)-like protein
MTAAARTLYFARRQAIEWWGLLVSVAFAVVLGLGLVSASALWRGDLVLLSALAVYGASLARAVARELVPAGRRARGWAAVVRELELGLLLLVGVYVLVALTGGAHSFLYPLVYALVSFLLVVHRSSLAAAGWVAAACGLELLTAHASAPGRPLIAGYHVTFILFFAAGNVLVLSSLARRMRGDHGRRVDAELTRMRQEARDFRLIASQLPAASRAERSREEEELRMAAGAVQGVHDQLFFNLDLLSSSLSLHTCALLWIKDDPASASASAGRATPTLEIKEIATASEMVRESPTLESPGVLAGVLREPKPLRLKALRGKRLPPYYQGPEAVTDLCAVPLIEGAALRGVLCADRTGDREFTAEEETVLAKAGVHVMRILEQERAFAAVERSKYEQEQFYRASELLNQALTVDEVHDRTFVALASIVSCELLALTSYDAGAGRHRVSAVRVSEERWKALEGQLEGLAFGEGAGLVSLAVKNRHHVPATGQLADAETPVFGDVQLPRARSLLVLPLVRGDQVTGTLVLACARGGAFPARTRDMLRVIANQVGVSLQNARMYQSMELRATTDGLTGLTNHRAFQDRFEQLHALAERTGHKFAVILTDIDHFKSVNDTYGHPVGDLVLKRVAAIFAGRARKVDIVARYGGEEFVIVLPDTDGAGAALFAERVREEVAAQTMTSEHGSFTVTLSMGIAEFPADGVDRLELIEKSDQALYWCKEHGRNRVTRWARMG